MAIKQWTSATQLRYMRLVEQSRSEGSTRAKKTVSDANLQLTSGQHFILEDDLAEAYRAGAIDALSEEV